MRLVLFGELCGLWLEDSAGERDLCDGRSSVDISVTDGSGCVLSGKLFVSGVPHAVVNGACKLLTKHFSDHGASAVEFVSEGGVRRPCADIRRIPLCGWHFLAPSESVDDGDILRLLGRLAQLAEKLDAARALCSETVSEVLGI